VELFVCTCLVILAAVGWGRAAANGDALDRERRAREAAEAECARLRSLDLRRAALLGDAMRGLSRTVEAAEAGRNEPQSWEG
jgi:hypothetical protein